MLDASSVNLDFDILLDRIAKTTHTHTHAHTHRFSF